MRNGDFLSRIRQASRATWKRSRRWARRNLPPGLRLVAGLALIVMGVFGFLPVLGFWMIQLGLGIASLDVMPIWRWWTGGAGDAEALEQESQDED